MADGSIPFVLPDSFHSQHSPFGAFASFTIGLVDAPGGFGQALRGPANPSVYEGCRRSAADGWRLLPFLTPSRSLGTAFTGGSGFGYAAKRGRGVSLRQGFDVLTPRFFDHRGLHVIAGETALVFTVPTGRRRPRSIGFYAGGPATTGISARYAYTRVFRDLEEVLLHGIAQHSCYVKLAAQRDRELAGSGLDADQRFFELTWHPWAVDQVLDLFADRYSYRDQFGLSFTHDMGVNNHFTPPGRSSYECDNLEGCFSHMTMEQLPNWILCAVTYAGHTGDHAWLRRRKKILSAGAEARATAGLSAETPTTKFEAGAGFSPAVEEPVCPLFPGLRDAGDRNGRFDPPVTRLGRHLTRALPPGRCLDSIAGSWKMSSPSTNTWFSKIARAQRVVRCVFPEAMSPAARAGDRVHAGWQRHPVAGGTRCAIRSAATPARRAAAVVIPAG